MKFDQDLPTRAQHRMATLATGPLGFLVALLAFGLAAAPTAVAQFNETGGTIKTKDLGSGPLDVNYFFESSAADNHGYLQVEVLTLKGPSPSQRNLDIVLFANSNSTTAQTNVAFHFKVVLPEGATTTQAAIPFFLFGGSAFGSNNNSYLNWDVGVFEDDRDIEQSRRLNNSGKVAYPTFVARRSSDNIFHICNRSVSASTTLHLLDDGAKPSNARALRMRVAQEGGVANDAANTGLAMSTQFGLTRDTPRISNFRHYGTAPDLWQYYLQFRIVVLDKSVLAKLRATRPTVALALKHYVAAGGNVILVGSREYNGKQLVDQWLLGTDQVPAAQTHAWRSVNRSVESWWLRDPLRSTVKVNVANPNGPPGYANSPYGIPQSMNRSATVMPTTRSETDAAPWASNIVRDMLAVERDFVPASLSMGSVGRDSLTAVETYLAAETHNLQVMSKVVGNWLFSDGAELIEEGAMAAAGVTSMGYPVPAPSLAPAPGTPAGMEETTESTETNAANIQVDWKGISPNAPPKFPLLSFDVKWIAPYLWQKMDSLVSDLEYQDTDGIALRAHVLGHVAVVEPDLTAFPVEALQALSEELSDSVALGTHSLFDEMWAYRNLIDSVGKPPVWTFCAIVLLFGMMLGPGLLTFTGWMRRRSLLIFLVPCVSLVATLLIAVYEVLHEGFGTNVRINSVLAVDELTGEGFAWSRQTCFSGWPPREGLIFPNDVYYRPVDAVDFYWRHYNSRPIVHPRESVRGHIYVNSDNSQWRGAVRAREQQQFLIGHPAKIAVPLKVSRLDRKRIRIQNLTQEELPFALVRDEDKGFYFTQDLAAGAGVECEVQSFDDIGGLLSRFRADMAATLPLGMQSLGLGAYDRGQIASEIIDRVWLASLSEGESSFKLQPKGFVTLLRNSDQIFVPLKATTIESTHLVVGRLAW